VLMAKTAGTSDAISNARCCFFMNSPEISRGRPKDV
jgi:hypothetical protein